MICNAQETIGRSPSARNKEEKKMVTNDATILRLKHDVLYEVAKEMCIRDRLIPYLAPVVSPMIAHGKLLKEELGRDVKVVFLGPCIAKKKEAMDLRHEGYIDACLLYTSCCLLMLPVYSTPRPREISRSWISTPWVSSMWLPQMIPFPPWLT